MYGYLLLVLLSYALHFLSYYPPCVQFLADDNSSALFIIRFNLRMLLLMILLFFPQVLYMLYLQVLLLQ